MKLVNILSNVTLKYRIHENSQLSVKRDPKIQNPELRKFQSQSSTCGLEDCMHVVGANKELFPQQFSSRSKIRENRKYPRYDLFPTSL